MNGTMEFVSFDVTKKTLSLKKAEIPKPGPNEVLIKVAYSGICGTDLHIVDGSFPCKTEGFLTLGHEFVGTIEEVGSDVQKFKIGQKVAVDPNDGCKMCNFCHSGNYHFCKNGGIRNTVGIYKDGGWATHAVIPVNQVHLLPEGMEMHQAVLAEPLSCMSHGWDKISPVNVGLNVLVIGAGIIGLLWTCLLHLHGLRRTVTISEPQDKRRNMASKLGHRLLMQMFENAAGDYESGLDYKVKSPAELKEEFDLAVDCSGSGPAMEGAVSLLRQGGRLCVFGVASPNAKLTIEPFQVYMKELNIVGVNINPFSFPKGLALLQAMADKYINYEKLGIKVFSLSQYREALEALKRGDISKAVFKM